MVAYYPVHIMTLTHRILQDVKMLSLALNRQERHVLRRNRILHM